MMRYLRRYHDLILILLIILENLLLLVTYKMGLGQTKNAILYFGISMIIGLFLLFRYTGHAVAKDVTQLKDTQKSNWLLLCLALLPLVFFAGRIDKLLTNVPINPRSSDVIPLIQIMVQRFINGIPVYIEPIYDFGYVLNITYLPIHWLPFVIAQKGHFDYRWIPFIAWSISSVILIIRAMRTTNIWYKICVPGLLYLGYCITFIQEKGMFAHTVEMLIAAYYMLLIVGLNKDNIIVSALVITCCLMSRYSLVLWLPVWALVYITSGRYKDFLKITGLVIVLVALVYVIPFLSQDWGSFYRGYKYYDAAALGEWNNLDYLGKPYQLYNGIGFAHIFYEQNRDWQIIDKIKQLQKVHLIASLGICLAISIWYWFYRKKIDTRIFLMASFKIYFTVFLVFIQVPYIYLMVVANFVSIAIFAEQLRYRALPKTSIV